MAELTLISSSQRPLQPLVEGALQNELRLLEVGHHKQRNLPTYPHHKHAAATNRSFRHCP